MYHITQASEHCVRLTVNKWDCFQSVNLIFCIRSLTNTRGVSCQQPLRMKAPRKKEEYYCPHRLVFAYLDSQI